MNPQNFPSNDGQGFSFWTNSILHLTFQKIGEKCRSEAFALHSETCQTSLKNVERNVFGSSGISGVKWA
jgi:hypothetical protein